MKATQALIDKHMKLGAEKGSKATAAALLNAVTMAGNEGGVNHALEMAGGGEAAEEVGDDGEKEDDVEDQEEEVLLHHHVQAPQGGEVAARKYAAEIGAA